MAIMHDSNAANDQVKVGVYYRNYFTKELRQVNANVELPLTREGIEDAVLAVKEQCVFEAEAFENPVLVLIQGGKQ